MKKLLYTIIAIALCLSTALWYGCKDKEELPGEIHGIVTDKATGEPIKTAGVELQPVGLKTVTGTEGQFEFNELEPGTYKLYVTKTGYEDLLSSEIAVKPDQTAKGDVQIEKLPPALKILAGTGKELDTLNFGAAESDEARSFNIFNDGEDILQWQITKTAKWIESFSVASGRLEAGGMQAVVVTIDRDQLDEKQNATTIQVTSNNGSKELLVLAMNNRVPIVVNVMEATNVTASTAMFHGKIVNEGNPPVTERGFVYTTGSVATLENTIEKLTVAVNEDKTYSIQVRNLELGKTYNVRAYAMNSIGVVYSSNSVSVAPEATLPSVETEPIASVNIANGTAIFNGKVLEAGDPAYTEKGFVYGLVPNPTVDDTKKEVSGNGTGKYSANISGLEEGKEYHVRAYVTNANGTAYGEDKSVDMTAMMPEVQTTPPTNRNIANGTVTFNGTIAEIGDLPYTERGFVYADVHNPTLDDTKVTASGSGTGDFSANVSDIQEGKIYYIRAYVTNRKGTVYGEEVPLDFSATMPKVQTKECTNRNLAVGTVKFNGNITDAGDLPITERGFVYADVHSPTLDNTKVIAAGNGTGDFSVNASNIQKDKVYYIRAYATNRKGTVYGNEVSVSNLPAVETGSITSVNIANGTAIFNGIVLEEGDPAYTEKGFVYGIVPNPTIDATKKVVSSNGTGEYSANINGLEEGKEYYIRAYATNANGTAYGEDKKVDMTATMPTVQTKASTNNNVANGTVTFNGTVTGIGDLPYTERGFVYADVHNPTLDDTKVTASGSGIGDFSVNASGIQEGKIYYIRAYVTNRKGTVYGDEVSVDFNAAMPTVKTKAATNKNVANGTATFNGTIAAIGDLPYTERGFVYADVHNPTLDDTKVTASGSGIGDFSVNASGIQEGKIYYIRAYVTNRKGTVYGDEVSVDFNAAMPTVKTKAATNRNVANGTATFNGTITTIGDFPYTERGFVYAEVHNPTLDDTKVTASGSGIGDFSVNASGIQEGKIYYIRAYVTNRKGTVYGDEVSVDFNAVMPTVKTKATTNRNVADGTVTFNGTVTGIGDLPYTERGFVYADVHNPTLDYTKVTAAGNSIGDFSVNASGIQEGKVYYIRAYVTNNKGTVYGEEVSVDFNAAMPTVQTKATTNRNVADGTVTFNGTVTGIGDLPYTERGFVYADVHNPTLDYTKVTAAGNSTGDFSVNASGIQEGKVYYIRAYVTNNKGTVYGEEVSVDFNAIMPVVQTLSATDIQHASRTAMLQGNILSMGDYVYTEKGFVYAKDHNPDIIKDTKLIAGGDGLGFFTTMIKNLVLGDIYYIRAYATNKLGTSYGEEIVLNFKPPKTELTTDPVSNIHESKAILNGTILNIGNPAYTEKGFVYSTFPSPSYVDYKAIVPGVIEGKYSLELRGLTVGTTYYVRAFARQEDQIVYGAVQSFVAQ